MDEGSVGPEGFGCNFSRQDISDCHLWSWSGRWTYWAVNAVLGSFGTRALAARCTEVTSSVLDAAWSALGRKHTHQYRACQSALGMDAAVPVSSSASAGFWVVGLFDCLAGSRTSWASSPPLRSLHGSTLDCVEKLVQETSKDD